MQLWTEYEGVTVEGAFPLEKLLMPEGRSALFSTVGPDGEPTVVRLIECHFDEEAILARWRCVEALSHPNLLKFERFGQTELDGRMLVYAVFEKVDANLAVVLDQGHLTVTDVAQLASSLVAALDVLHTHGFIHEHIEPRNVFAINGIVKLRGDYIREAPEGEEGRAAKQRDVRALATVLLQGLTQRASLEGVPDSALPAPFGQIIREGLDGGWGLEQIKTAFEGHSGSKQPTMPKSVNAAPPTAAVVEHITHRAAAAPSRVLKAQLPIANQDGAATYARSAACKGTWPEDQSISQRSRSIGAVTVALLLLFSKWVLMHAWNAHSHNTTPVNAVLQPAPGSAEQTSIGTAPRASGADLPGVSLPALAGSHAGWRVIAYTYNRRTDADRKVSDLSRTHPQLNPSVYTRSGHSPYLVSIGGVMERDAAYALARRSRSLGYRTTCTRRITAISLTVVAQYEA